MPVSRRIWTIAEARAKLSEVLRLAEEEGPQRIGVRKSFIVAPEHGRHSLGEPGKPLGRWLVENMPRGIDLEIPLRSEPARRNPFELQQGK